MAGMVKFFSPEEEQRIIGAIQAVEKRTTGEIRVHLERKSSGNILDDAVGIFHRLNMHDTKAHNGVLIVIVPSEKQFAIIGDEGIDDVLPDNFWEDERNLMVAQFKKGQYCEGVVKAIEKIGDKLQAHFPVTGEEENPNELPDDISYS